MPYVSVIIPTYNRERYIEDSVKSVLNQTFKDFELIVIDDGSKDNTKGILQPYMQQIRYVYQDNKGHASARNAGLMISKGKYIAFNDSDDILLPNILELLLEFMESRNEIGLIFVDLEVFNEKGVINKSFLSTKKILKSIPSIKELNNRKVLPKDVFNEMIKEYFIASPGTMIKKEVFEKVGLFDETLFNQADRDMWFRIGREYRIGYIDQVLVRCRQHPGNFRVNTEFIINSHIELLDKIIKKYKEIPRKSKRIAQKKLSCEYFELGYYYFSLDNVKLARKNFLTSILYKPFINKSYFYLISIFFGMKFIKGIRYLKGKFSSIVKTF